MKVNKEKGEETKRKDNFYAKKSEIKSSFHTNKPMFVLLYKETLLTLMILILLCLVLFLLCYKSSSM